MKSKGGQEEKRVHWYFIFYYLWPQNSIYHVYGGHALFKFSDNMISFSQYSYSYLNSHSEITNLHGKEKETELNATLDKVIAIHRNKLNQKLANLIACVSNKFEWGLNLMAFKEKHLSIERGEAIIEHMIEYIDNNLVTMSGALLEPVFVEVLAQFWNTFVKSMTTFVQVAYSE